jgi:tRNA G10  N-methylase Trm11
MLSLSNNFIQTPAEVWTEILKRCPIRKEEIFYEPFAGQKSLYNQIETNKKYYTEITEGLDVFDFSNNDITTIYTNPPFKVELTNKKGITKPKNCIYYFLEYFATHFVSLNRIGFLINTSCFQSLTPKRLEKLDELGFNIKKIIVMNIQKWYGRYYFVLFEKQPTNKPVEYISKYFT